MSRVSEDAKTSESAPRITRALGELHRMITQGRSFSGNERHCCFLNLPGRFATVSAVTGLDFPDDGRAVAVVDWDQDGDLDLWFSNRNAPRLRFMRNDTPSGHHFLSLRLQGNGKTTNRDAIGARVQVVLRDQKDKILIRSVRAGEGFLAQSSRALHFGLGNQHQIDKVVVRWPGGDTETFTEVRADQQVLLVQGTGKAQSRPAKRHPSALTPAAQQPLPSTSTARIPLVTRLPMAEASYVTFGSQLQKLTFTTGKPKLIVLWASWCGPCRVELRELAERAEQIRAAGLDVVALAVDGLDDDDDSTPMAAATFCDVVKFPFTTGAATADLVQLLTGYHHMVVTIIRPLPVPTSFLIDGQGRLAVIYKGRINIDDVLRDARREPGTLRDRCQRAAFLPGRMAPSELPLNSLRRLQANTLFAMGRTFAKGKRPTEAEKHFRDALAIVPDFGLAHRQLAFVLDDLDRHHEAAKQYRYALKQFPKDALLHLNFGEMLARHRQFHEAHQILQRALALQPTLQPARRALERIKHASR